MAVTMATSMILDMAPTTEVMETTTAAVEAVMQLLEISMITTEATMVARATTMAATVLLDMEPTMEANMVPIKVSLYVSPFFFCKC